MTCKDFITNKNEKVKKFETFLRMLFGIKNISDLRVWGTILVFVFFVLIINNYEINIHLLKTMSILI